MRKKHFTGVLMLTAAVALGTVSPVALPNTATVVKADTAVTDIDDASLSNVDFEVVGKDKIKIYSKNETANPLSGMLADKYTYGFGATKAAASTAAISAAAKKIEVKNGVAEITIPDTTKLHLVVLSKDDKVGVDKVKGKAKEFHIAPKPADVSLASKDDAEQLTTTVPNLEYTEVTGVNGADFDENKVTWKEPTKSGSDYKIPADNDKVKAGEKREFYVRVKAVSSTATFASPISDKITISKKTMIGLKDLKELNYTITDANKLKLSGLTGKVLNVATKSGTVAYKIIPTSTLATDDFTGGTDVNHEDFDTVAVTSGQSVIVFVKEDTDKKANSVVINAGQMAKPEVTPSAVKYQLVASGSYIVGGKYKIKKDGGNYSDAVLSMENGKNVISVDGAGTYSLKAVGEKTIKFDVATAATVKLDSEAQENIVVAALKNKLDAASFGAITLTTSNSAMKLTIGNIKKSLALEGADKDKVQYGYVGELKELTDVMDEVKVDIKEGKFMIEVVGNDALKRTINFIGLVDKDGKKFMPTYASSSAVLAAMGTSLNKYQVRPVSAGAMFNMVNSNSFNKEGKYQIQYKDFATKAAVKVGEEMNYLLPEIAEIEIKKETNKPSSPSNPVIPSGSGSGGAGGSAGGSTDTKKDDTKKADDKKNDTKKDGAMSDGNGAAVEKKELVTAKNTKNTTVKVSEEKIAEALETGLKVTAKSGEVKFTAKALKKVVGDAVEAVKVTLKATSEMAKNVKGSKLVSKQVFTLNIKAGNMTVKESQLNGTKIRVTLKVNLKKAPKTVWVMDLSTGKRVKATYKNGKLMFKTANLGKFVIVNKAK